ncbi:unnamed protein product [Clonostachys byssicola]|uniref:Uncharacterized protein n=1 Tax=Clonostachys byssicola TaxID=160290 RepID=A0A9N9UVD3_9HYPO|nr:unnamed protein product [Clonostachys byssicola]
MPPPRIVELDDAAKSFRVVATTQLASGSRYASFTHCYGPDYKRIPKATRDTSHLNIPCLLCLNLTAMFVRWLSDSDSRTSGSSNSQADQQSHQDKVLRRDILPNGFCGIGDTSTTSSSSGLFTSFDRGPMTPDIFLFQPRADAPPPPCAVQRHHHRKTATVSIRYEPISMSVQALRDRLSTPDGVLWQSDCHAAHHDELGTTTLAEHGPHIVAREGELRPSGSMPVVKLWKPLLEYSTH